MRSEKEQSRINKVIETTLRNISDIIDVNTVIGAPINSDDGSVVIPISKVSVGVLAGGGEYGKISIFKNGSDLPYSAGNGAIISVKPYGFLIKENNEYKILSVAQTPSEKLIEKATEFIEKLNKNDKN